MLAEITREDFDGWIAYEQLEPFGTRAAIRIAGQLFRTQLTEDVDDDDVSALMGYVEPEAPVTETDVDAIARAFGAQ